MKRFNCLFDAFSTAGKELFFVGHYCGGQGVVNHQKKLKKLIIDEYKLNKNNFFNF
jgi:hypothetical protein